nr:clathrin heavy chain 1 [Ipomoea batatas]
MESDKVLFCVTGRQHLQNSCGESLDMNMPMPAFEAGLLLQDSAINVSHFPEFGFERLVSGKWITPKMLGLVTQTAVYHWPLKGNDKDSVLISFANKILQIAWSGKPFLYQETSRSFLSPRLADDFPVAMQFVFLMPFYLIFCSNGVNVILYAEIHILCYCREEIRWLGNALSVSFRGLTTFKGMLEIQEVYKNEIGRLQ